ncbi:MAG: L-histidine N(alpha)-methyltransferase [Planctomycetes bacterium]|nr:L-histidine N(alpha)-methyltransferase [Planctomycetota bacterium]
MNDQLQTMRDLDQMPETARFLGDVLDGLSSDPPRLPCKYFYDQRGSELFDRICELDEYYLTRTEVGIMEQYGPQMAEVLGPEVMLIEYGSGSSVKTRILLDHLSSPAAYVPVDISCEHLCHTAERLSEDYPELPILPTCADFTSDFELPPCPQTPRRRAVYFPGSTIGNFTPPAATRILKSMRRQCDPVGDLIIGIDLQKDPRVLEAAYDDGQGVTAAFNLNLLHRINRELDARIPVDQFEHQACYNRREGRIEIYLVSRCDQTIYVGGERFVLSEGDRICTEYSHKYTIDGFGEMASQAGWRQRDVWTDSRAYFAVAHLVTESAG